MNRHPIAGVVVSMLVHGGALAAILAYTTVPDLGLEFSVPSEMEFGVTEGMDVTTTAAATAAENQAQNAQGSSDGTDGTGADAGRRHRDAGIRDAGMDGGLDASADASLDGEVDGAVDAGVADGGSVEVVDAGPPLPRVARGTEGRSRMGPGGDIAMRFDFQRMRGTPLEQTVGMFLASVRDFQIVVDQSGMDPMRDLDQFLMGSPDPLDRQKFHYVGRLTNDEDWARAAVARLAAAHGASAEWEDVGGVQVAPWHDGDDATAHRVLALLGNRYFILCRRSDLDRMFTWLAHQAELADRPASDGAAVALGVADDEVVSVEMENVRAYLAGSPEEVLATLPNRSRLSILRASDRLDVAFRADYPDAESAGAGAEHWNAERERVADSTAVRTFGFGRVLQELVLAPDETVVRARTDLSSSQVQLILGFAQMKLQQAYARWDNGGRDPED